MASDADFFAPECAACIYRGFMQSEIEANQAANSEAARRSAYVEDLNVAARRNRALQELGVEAELLPLMCDPQKGCTLAVYCIGQTIKNKQDEPFRQR